MGNDRELLELAAKAAGLEYDGVSRGEDVWFDAVRGRMHGSWNPLTDDGDAFRLAVELVICITPRMTAAATRRAIVCAAAEIGRRSASATK